MFFVHRQTAYMTAWPSIWALRTPALWAGGDTDRSRTRTGTYAIPPAASETAAVGSIDVDCDSINVDRLQILRRLGILEALL